MNGFRTLVFQDLSHVLPSKTIQVSSSHLHTTSSTRRFWSFFEFSGKEGVCRESRKCGSPKGISVLTSPDKLEDASRALPSLPVIPAITSMTLSPKTHAYQFDLKVTPMSCMKMQYPVKEDNLMSLLDGNPVPKTLKWKLKGYKTLRNEQAGDFAFVPGGESYDLDILSRNDCGVSVNAAKPVVADPKPPQQEKDSRKSTEAASDPNSANTLSPTAKSMENKVETQGTTKSMENKVVTQGTAKSMENKVETQGMAKSMENKVETQGTTKSMENKVETQGTAKSMENKVETQGMTKSMENKVETQGATKSMENKVETQGTAKSMENKVETQGATKSMKNKVETQGTAISMENKVETQGTTISMENKVETQGTTKSMEHKVETQGTMSFEAAKVSGVEPAKVATEMARAEAPSILNDQTDAIVGETAATSAQKLFIALATKDGVKYLPISKSELSSSQMKCQAQPSAQYSSRPPKKTSKPMPPMLRQRAENLGDTSKLTSTMEPRRQELPSSMEAHRKKLPLEYHSAPQAETSTPQEVTQVAASGWSSMGQEFVASETASLKQQTVNRSDPQTSMSTEGKPMGYRKQEQARDEQLNSPQLSSQEEYHQGEPYRNAPQDVSRTAESKVANASSYFAPRSWKRSDKGAHNQPSRLDNKSTHESLNNVYESFGWGSRDTSTLNISSPNQKQENTSPCAATHARLQESHSDEPSQSQRTRSHGGDGSSMSGNSNGGSRKPPSYPPFSTRRVSSNSSSRLVRLPSGGVQGLSRGSGGRWSNGSNISTASVNPSPRKCNDGDEGKMICTKPKRNKCPRRRSCEDEEPEPKCQREAKPKNCKRYCCPALQIPTDCDYDDFTCPKPGGCGQKPRKRRRDPTCRPNDSCQRPSCGRERRPSCGAQAKRPDCQQRTKKCDTNRQDRGCNQNRNSCRTREKSCQRQEQQSCNQGQGREVCTKPKRKEPPSCNRRRCDERDSCNRSAKCTGRRHYTQAAFTRQAKADRDLKSFSSLPVVGFSLVGVKARKNKSSQDLADLKYQNRFYGKPTTCKGSESEKMSSKCNKEPKCGKKSKKCKKGPAKCLNKKSSEDSCKPHKIEAKCSSSCGKSKPKKEDSCKGKSKSEDFCAKRRQQLCKDRKSSSQSEDESPKERAERERKEMQECKKGGAKDKSKKGGDAKDKCKKASKEAAAPTGLERVISPCKQKQMKKGKGEKGGCSSSKAACIGVPLNCYANTDPSTFMRQESKLSNSLVDRPYSTVQHSDSEEFDTDASSPNQRKSFWNFAGDDGLGLEGEPLPVVIDNQEEGVEDSACSQNWFVSLFNGANP